VGSGEWGERAPHPGAGSARLRRTLPIPWILHSPCAGACPGAGVCLPPAGGGREGGGIKVIGNQYRARPSLLPRSSPAKGEERGLGGEVRRHTPTPARPRWGREFASPQQGRSGGGRDCGEREPVSRTPITTPHSTVHFPTSGSCTCVSVFVVVKKIVQYAKMMTTSEARN